MSKSRATIDLSKIDDFSYSAVMRSLRQQCSEEDVREFQTIYKKFFDILDFPKDEDHTKMVLVKALKIFYQKHDIKIDPALFKTAAVNNNADPDQTARYLASLVRFLTLRISPESRAASLSNLARKLYQINEMELSNKNIPPSSSLGQAVMLVKNTLADHDPAFIRSVLNSLSKYLASNDS